MATIRQMARAGAQDWVATIRDKRLLTIGRGGFDAHRIAALLQPGGPGRFATRTFVNSIAA